MPVYEYENATHRVSVHLPFAIAERPEKIELRRAASPGVEFYSAEHDVTVRLQPSRARTPRKLVLRRRQVPSRIMVGVGARPPTVSDKMRVGYKKLEEKGQLKDHPNYLPVSAIKKALEMPTV